MKKTGIKRIARMVIFFVMVLISLTMLYPLVFMLINTFKDMTEYLKNPLALPGKLRLNNYVAMYNAFRMHIYFLNTLLVSTCALLISLSIGVISSYAFAKIEFRWKKPIYMGVLSLMMIPGMVMVIPLYVLYSRLGLIDNRLSLILAFSVGSLPYTVFLLTSNFRAIPKEMIEAVKMDGGTFFRIIASVVLPMGKASIIAIGIFNFIGYWNELLYAMLFINSETKRSMTAAVANMGGRYISNMPMIMTGLTLTCVPVIIIYIVFQRYIMKGMAVGAIK